MLKTSNLARWRFSLIIVTLILVTTALYSFPISAHLPSSIRLVVEHPNSVSNTEVDAVTKELIAISVKGDATSWIAGSLPDWSARIYVVDDPTANLTVPVNKGRESMAYLTHIINNYNNLPKYTAFIHAQRYQWHNDDPIYDHVPVLQSLRLEHVDKVGYQSLRCAWGIGCPRELHPLNPSQTGDDRSVTERKYAMAISELFPNMTTPEVVGAPCCSQFVVTRDRIRERSLDDYIRYRDWLRDTELQDSISGRIFEYSWHMIFQMPPVYCPSAEECYCQAFGHCNLTCFSPGSCENRYIMPAYANMPDGWPEQGGGKDGWPEPGWAD